MSSPATPSRRNVVGAMAALAALAWIPRAAGQSDNRNNFPDKRALIVNVCPHIELLTFYFENRYADRRSRFEQNLSWKITSEQPVIAFEIVILKYDAFDQRVIGSRVTIEGRNSVDWSPAQPGQENRDGTISYTTENIFTAIAYVRTARLKDGTIWRVNESGLNDALRKVAPGIKDFGSVRPDPRPVAGPPAPGT